MAKNIPRMCKKENMKYAMTIGVSIIKDIEKKSFEKGACSFHLPFGEFDVIIVRSKQGESKIPKKVK